MTMTAGSLASLLNGELRGEADAVVADVRPIHVAGPTDLAFAGDDHHLRKLRKSKAGVALLARSLADDAGKLSTPKAILIVDDPLAAAVQVLERLRPRRKRAAIGRSTQAIVSPSARIGEGTNIHPGAIVGDEVSIGRNCEIHPGVVIGPACTLGDDVILYPNVVLYADVSIGNRVIVHAGAVLGADGFGYRLVKGKHTKIPHYGDVRLEDDVEIGANTTIDRAMMGTTIVGTGTKIDNLVMIAHNCELGRHNVLASQVGFAGSSTTGDYVVCAGQVGIADHVHLGDQCTLGAKAGVHKDMGQGTFHGTPALPEVDALRIFMATRKLPEMKEQFRELQEQVKALTAKLAALTDGKEAKPAA